MGAHYSSIQIRSEDRAAVKTAVEVVAREFKKKFLLGPVLDGWIAVYPDDAGKDEQCAAAFAKRLNAVVLHLMVYDSDIFFYNFFRCAELLNEYSSDPDSFEEVSVEEHERLKARPELFRELVKSPECVAELARLLERGESKIEFTFEERRLEQFAKLLGIRNSLTSYEYFTNGERDGLKDWKGFVHIPDQSAEKAARKAAAAVLRAEKQRLQKEGLLCFEMLPPGNKKERIHVYAEICFDPLQGGLMLLWNRPAGENPQILYLQRPWTGAAEVLDVTMSRFHFQSYLTVSRSGRWLAFFDEKLRLWDRELRKFTEIAGDTTCYPALFSEDEKYLLYQRQHNYGLISLETFQTGKAFFAHCGVQALHPSNKYLVTKPAQEKLGILNLDTGKLEKSLFCGLKMDWSHVASVFEGTVKQVGLTEQQLAGWKTAFVRGNEQIFSMSFSPDGQRLCCATTGGIRVFAWADLLQAVESTPKPISSFSLHPDAINSMYLDEQHYANFMYDVIFDEPQNRLLFGGIEGTIRFLNLNDGTAGVLLDPPGKSPVSKLRLAPDREVLCCFCIPKSEERNQKESRVQVWNYPGLCRRVGLSF